MNEDKWILVETEVKYRMYYLIKANDLVDSANAAKVILGEMDDVLEFSQEFIGETPVAVVDVLNKNDAIELFKKHNDYLKNLDDDSIVSMVFMEKTK